MLMAGSWMRASGFAVAPGLASCRLGFSCPSLRSDVLAGGPAWGPHAAIRLTRGPIREVGRVLHMSGDVDDVGFSKKSRKATKKAAGRKKDGGNAVTKPPVEVVETVNQKGMEAKDEARKSIERMEKEQAERQEKQMQRVKDVISVKEATKDNPNAGVVPEVVANRMLKRMIPFFILPVVSGVGVFVSYFILAKKYDFEVQPTTVAITTQLPFFIALVGITYAILSASWDEDREGSFLGFDEVKSNLGNIFDGLRRSSDRAEVEEAMEEAEKRIQARNRYERRQQARKEENKGED
ncbi:unnamed protein product [Discosporangium mesarthrocarpum]